MDEEVVPAAEPANRHDAHLVEEEPFTGDWEGYAYRRWRPAKGRRRVRRRTYLMAGPPVPNRLPPYELLTSDREVEVYCDDHGPFVVTRSLLVEAIKKGKRSIVAQEAGSSHN